MLNVTAPRNFEHTTLPDLAKVATLYQVVTNFLALILEPVANAGDLECRRVYRELARQVRGGYEYSWESRELNYGTIQGGCP